MQCDDVVVRQLLCEAGFSEESLPCFGRDRDLRQHDLYSEAMRGRRSLEEVYGSHAAALDPSRRATRWRRRAPGRGAVGDSCEQMVDRRIGIGPT